MSRLLWLLVAGLLAVSVGGCGGCRNETAEELQRQQEEQAKKRPKPNYELAPQALATLPGQSDRRAADVKPGHWTSALTEVRANNFDVRGTWQIDYRRVDNGAPLALDEVAYRLETTRLALLPKGQKRLVEQTLFVPPAADSAQASLRLVGGLAGGEQLAVAPLLRLMPAMQYHLVVFAREPDRYRFLNALDTVRFPSGEPNEPDREAHFQVVLPLPKQANWLADNALRWTSTAYLIWDDRSADELTEEQQTALVDWLHFGGQLIVSGPDSLDTLRRTFLDRYLPADSGGLWEISADELASLHGAPWSKEVPPLRVAAAWSGVHLKPRADCAAETTLNSAGVERPLVVERRVGRGRVAVTAFRLTTRDLTSWLGFDRWFHGLLLRRPARLFQRDVGLELGVRWADGAKSNDARRVSNLRFLARDLADEPWSSKADAPRRTPATRAYQRGLRPPGLNTAGPEEDRDEVIGPGVGAWNDRGVVATTAREALRSAAGIVVPDARFVLRVIGLYLLVLVPVNALVFRLLGRLEWAWAAMPVITLGATGLVVYLAQLDIGFVRARTEVGLVELYADHPRGHVARFTALYSSLGTNYDLEFDDPSAVALPFAANLSSLPSESLRVVQLRRLSGSKADDDQPIAVRLENFEVSSNATGMVHSEQMFAAGGAITCRQVASGRYRLQNDTRLDLLAAGVVGERRGAWLGSIAAGAVCEFELGDNSTWYAPWDEFWSDQNQAAIPRVNLHELGLRVARDADYGGLRLIACTSSALPGVEIHPPSSQLRAANLVVVHLRPTPLAAVETDSNTRPPMP